MEAGLRPASISGETPAVHETMIVAMAENAAEEQIQRVIERLVNLGYEVHRSTGAQQTVLGVVGKTIDFDIRDIEVMEGVREVHRVSSPYKLVARSFRPEGTVVKFGSGLSIGGPDVVVMAGPCSVESREQLFTVAEQVAKSGARVLRGGAFKPRSSPYSFQGMGEDGLKLLREAGDKFGLLVISEVMEISQIPLMMPYVDIFQIGARNMQNFNLLREIGKVRKPAMLKRGIAATLEEMLLSAEYIMSGGNYDVILCERGIRTFETYTRNTMDISAIPIVHKLSHLPMTADPSHGTGRRDKVSPMARASVAAGADAVIVEVHHQPDKALSDGAQSLYPEQFAQLMDELRMIAPAVGRKIA
jgi:3-deoxy-7-phosphoheptulonate synthase